MRLNFELVQKVMIACVLWAGCAVASAAVINVTTNDSYTKIESAKAGDEVVIAPGTYAFRVYLTRQAGQFILFLSIVLLFLLLQKYDNPRSIGVQGKN
jgi:hypothetical protein